MVRPDLRGSQIGPALLQHVFREIKVDSIGGYTWEYLMKYYETNDIRFVWTDRYTRYGGVPSAGIGPPGMTELCPLIIDWRRSIPTIARSFRPSGHFSCWCGWVRQDTSRAPPWRVAGLPVMELSVRATEVPGGLDRCSLTIPGQRGACSTR